MRQSVRAIIIKDNHLLVMHRNKFGSQYYALVGGSIDFGEGRLEALERELREESGVVMANPRLVIEEDAGPMFGMQYIYLCDYVSGEPALAPDSEEAKIHAMGRNLYRPEWLPVSQLPQANLLPVDLKRVLVEGLQHGFGTEPYKLTIRS